MKSLNFDTYFSVHEKIYSIHNELNQLTYQQRMYVLVKRLLEKSVELRANGGFPEFSKRMEQRKENAIEKDTYTAAKKLKGLYPLQINNSYTSMQLSLAINFNLKTEACLRRKQTVILILQCSHILA